MSNKNYLNIFFSIIVICLLIFLIHSSLIDKIIWKGENLFGDLKIPINWLKCKYLGFDLYKESIKSCPNFDGVTFAYGHIFLIIPFNNILEIFYINYLPYLIIITFVFSIILIINPKTKFEYMVVLLCIFNPSTILLIERMNVDIFIFLISIFITFNRFYFLNWFIVYFAAFTKIYPIILGVNILIENKNRILKKYIFIFLSIIIVSLLYLFFYLNEYLFLLENLGTTKAGYHYLFSLNTFPKIFKYIFNFNYILLMLFFYLMFFLLTKFFYNKLKNTFSKIVINIYCYKTKLFILGSSVSFVCYIIFSNYFYREVFLILTLPYLLSMFNLHNNNLLKYLLNLIVLKYLFLYIYSYVNIHDGIIHVDSIRYFSNKFLLAISIKGFIDFILMSFFGALIFLITVGFFNEFKRTKLIL
jgi:hypothetical protein